ncbi:MAG: hypothetical protein RLZZ142_2252 [Verrucomicrobiota bacterium]|jgi:uncharacterized protein YaeQ
MKATIFKAQIEFADMDHHVYEDFSITLARHPSETDERLLVRLLAFTLNAPSNSDHGVMEFAKDLWNIDEPCLWQKNLTGETVHWIDVGQPDEKRIQRVCARSERVSVYSYDSSTPIWWTALAPKLTRARNLQVWQIPSEQSQALALLAQRSMKLHVSIQDQAIWITDESRSLEVSLNRLFP